MRYGFIVALSPVILFQALALAQNINFDADSAYAYLEHLCVTIGPRPMGSANERAALLWAAKNFHRFGADTAYVMAVPEARGTINTNSGVAIGIFRGKNDSTIVIGGHIDSSGREIPGANDDGSGTACVIELARVWSQRPRRFTLLFAAFGGEESGLVGSRYFVDHYTALDLAALMLQIDMAGSTEALIPFIDVYTHQAPVWLVEDAYAIDRALGYNSLEYPTHFFSLNNSFKNGGAGSDHQPFLEKNIPAIDFTAGVNTSPIHTQRDRMDFISKPMLARSGRLVHGLLAKYQEQGIPAPTKGHYMLWQPFGMRLYIPAWLITALNISAVLLGGLAFYQSRKNRLRIEKTQRVKFSGFKLFFMMVGIAISMQLGEALLQDLKDLRYPWMVPFNQYLWFAAVWTIAGVWLTSQLTRRWRFSPDPYVYAKRAAIFLIIYTLLFALASLRLALYPALSLIGLSLAILLPAAMLKILAAILAFIPMCRLMFFEMLPFGARSLATQLHGINTFFEAFLYSVFLTIIILLWYLPLLYLFAYTLASTWPRYESLKHFRKPIVGNGILVTILGYGGYLLTLPSYDDVWRAEVQVNADYTLPSGKNKLRLVGNEYFRQVTVTADTLRRHYDATIHEDELPVAFEANWLKLSGSDSVCHGGQDTVMVNWLIASTRRWQRTSLQLKVDTLDFKEVKTSLRYAQNKGKLTFAWQNEPPESLRVAVGFTISPGSKVVREVTATYSEMPIPVNVSAALADVIYRTTVTHRDTLVFP